MNGYKLLTFVGIGKRFETEYLWENHSFKTAHFAQALCTWLKLNQVLVFLTERAQHHENWFELRDFMQSQGIEWLEIPIPDGRNEQEYWQIFHAMTEHLIAQDEVLIDVTHGFRSLPLLGFMAAAYLQTVRQIHIKHLLYGAFDARQEGQTPVFDLSPFLSLLNWMQAAQQFIQTGLSQELGQLLKDKQAELNRNQATPELPKRLKGMGENLEFVSQALMLNNPFSLAQATRQMLSRHLPDIQPEANRWTPAFETILTQVSESYLPFAEDDLESQRQLIQWYLEHGHWIQSATLASEWLISYACAYWLGEANPPYKTRDEISKALNGYSKARQNKGAIPEFAQQFCQKYSLDNLPQPHALLDLIDSLPRLRNELAHCGMGKDKNPNQADLKRILSQLTEYIHKIQALELPAKQRI